MDVANITKKIEMLPINKRQEISDFVDFLLFSSGNAGTEKSSSDRKHPYAGCMSGTFGPMSDDFNEPQEGTIEYLFKDYSGESFRTELKNQSE